MLDVMLEEADASIKQSYENGYKAGMLEYAPQNEALKSMNESMKAELEAEKSKLQFPAYWGIIFTLCGFTAGVLVMNM